MGKAIIAMAAIACCAGSAAATEPTDFGIRTVGGGRASDSAIQPISVSSFAFDISSAAAIGRQWGVVTSTYRSPDHNRRVGGVPNSYHLRGRAIDIARRPGVRHHQIAAAYRAAGYHLVESLDEGDHSHFAFGSGGGGVGTIATIRTASGAPLNEKPAMQMVRTGPQPTDFRIVTAPSR